MKNPTRLIFLLLTLICFRLDGQYLEYWSSSFIGGDHDNGFLYKTDDNGENLEITHHFEGGILGGGPAWSLIQHSDGLIYGATFSGGSNDKGTIFSVSPVDNSFEVIYSFESSNVAGSLTEGTNGKLYGYTYEGNGSIFELDPVTKSFQTLHLFSRTDGRITYGNNQMVEVSENVLYGVMERGGSVNDDGIIFKYNISTSTFEVVHEFDRTEGRYPRSLRQYPDGTLYGSTSWVDGRIFDFDPTSGAISTAFEYPDVNGLIGDVLYGSDGQYYGITGTDGVDYHGSIYRANAASGEYTTLHSFLEHSGPHIPDAPLIQGSNGKYYGTTRYVSYANAGVTVFEYDPANEQFRVTASKSVGLAYHPLTEILVCVPLEKNISMEACDSYQFGEQLLTSSGNYQGIFQSQIGCDSTVDLTLTVNPSDEVYQEISALGSYYFDDQQLVQSGEYTGVFENQYGCDSTVHLSLEIESVLSIQEKNSIQIFPNPVIDNHVNVRFDKTQSMIKITITDLVGKVIKSAGYDLADQVILSLPESPGLYLLTIQTPTSSETKSILKTR